MGFGQGEGIALAELLSRQGGSPMMAVEIMRNLGGATPETQGILRGAGVTPGMGLGQTLSQLKKANLSGEQRRALYGRGIRGMGGVTANLGEFESLAGEYGAAAGGQIDLVSGYERVWGKDELAQQEFTERQRKAEIEMGQTYQNVGLGRGLKDFFHPIDTYNADTARIEGRDAAGFFGGVGSPSPETVRHAVQAGVAAGGREQARVTAGM
jgi:hypothetical protein